jgi:hypothetical protein
MRYKNNVGP